MTDPITDKLVAEGLGRLVDFAFSTVEFGFAREDVIAKVMERAAAGRTPDEIADDLVQWRKESAAAARAK